MAYARCGTLLYDFFRASRRPHPRRHDALARLPRDGSATQLPTFVANALRPTAGQQRVCDHVPRFESVNALHVLSTPRSYEGEKILLLTPPPRCVDFRPQGCWHVPAGADDEWLCIDVQRGLRMGLDRLTPLASKKRLEKPSETMAEEGHQDFASERGVAGVAGDNVAAQEDKLSEVS